MNTSTSLFAKALATENIFVSFDASAKTATFDVSSRTLIIPDWKVSSILRDMIVAHEVAHALFTPPEQLLSALDSCRERKLNPQGYKACINVIEDARIERLIKEKFPGCRRDFYSGYKEILDTDLFELKSLTPDDLTIVDKINLHFKFGLFNLMQIDLSPAEQKFMERVADAKTFDEVVELANELYAMAAEEEKEKGKGNGQFSSVGDLTEAVGKTAKRDGDLGKARTGRGNMKYEDFPHLSYPLPRCNSDYAIIPFDAILQDAAYQFVAAQDMFKRSNYSGDYTNFMECIEQSNTDLEQYRKESKNAVRELVAQFERRKAAEEIRKERMKPTGNINPDRLHQFKTHDDIFLRNLVRHEGKKHGMVMLIDWSGSMGDCIDGVVRQVLMLTWFCRKAKIPYEVFFYTETGGFSDPALQKDRMETTYEKRIERLYGKQYLNAVMNQGNNSLSLNDTSLRQMFSSKMNDEQTLKMERLLWSMARAHDRSALTNYSYLSQVLPACIHMHGTPSCEALMAAHDYLPKFREATGSQVVDFIFITDGEPTGLSRGGQDAYIPVQSVRVQHLATGRTLTVPACDRRGYIKSLNLDVQYFLVDEIRKLGCVTVGFSIGSMSGIGGHLLNRMVRKPAPMTTTHANPQEWALAQDKADKAYNDFYKKENFIPCDAELTPGFDEYYIVRPVKPVNSEMDDSVNATNSTLTKIRNQFLKSLNSRKVSRVFLSRFIDLIAGRKVTKFKFMG